MFHERHLVLGKDDAAGGERVDVGAEPVLDGALRRRKRERPPPLGAPFFRRLVAEDEVFEKVEFNVPELLLLRLSELESVSEYLLENESERFMKADLILEGEIFLFLFLRYQ